LKNDDTLSQEINKFSKFLINKADNLFDGLNSVYKRKQFYKENFDIINPVKVILKNTFSVDEGTTSIAENPTFGYYVPFKRSLEKLLQIIPETEKLEYSGNSGDIKTNVFDGDYIDKKLKSQPNKNQLVFAIYCDDLEIVNPIGSHRTKHKIS
jgi:hypothetical protein